MQKFIWLTEAIAAQYQLHKSSQSCSEWRGSSRAARPPRRSRRSKKWLRRKDLRPPPHNCSPDDRASVHLAPLRAACPLADKKTIAVVATLRQCGDDLTRENVMRQATSVKQVKLSLLLPGITLNTASGDYAAIKQIRLMRFNGTGWDPVGELMTIP